MRLMISVTSVAEAQQAILGGAQLLDVKNPAEGSLGAQSPGVIRAMKKAFSGAVQISAAIGNMPNLPGTAALAAFGAAVCGADYIKVGLYGLKSEADALALLVAVREAVREFDCAVIAAGYADYSRIGAISTACLPIVAAKAGAKGCLIDTAVKDGHALFDFLEPAAIGAFAEKAHSAGLLFAAAGALREEDLPLLRDSGVDIAGLRTAVCRNNQRNGPLDPSRLRALLIGSSQLETCHAETPRRGKQTS